MPGMNKSQGVIAGAFGCVFGVLGILTLGIIFVPLAALCSVIGLLRGATGPSVSGIAISLLGCVLTVTGFAFSPSLLLLTGGLLVASQSDSAATIKPAKTISTAEPSASATFVIAIGSDNLPLTGPTAFCRKPETLRSIMKSLSDTSAVKEANERVIDFENATTKAVNASVKTFSCHGVARLSNGQALPGTFSVLNNAAGDSIWNWMNDD